MDSNGVTIEKVVAAHLPQAETIIRTLAGLQVGRGQPKERPSYLDLCGVAGYQKFIFERFGEVITTPSIEGISKTNGGWLIVGDNRPLIAAQISLIIERYGLGVGMLVLHAQQLATGHIPLIIEVNGQTIDLSCSSHALHGSRSEQVLNVPIRKYRRNNAVLAGLSITKPEDLWDKGRVVHHDGDEYDCQYCSANEMFPSEVVVNVEGSPLGLSRDYSFGFTHSPFGNPLKVVHFLAWDWARNPLNMNRTPMTVSDLVILTKEINWSIIKFFAGTGIIDYPVIDGVSNGWAGNTIWHQHFQFFSPELRPPIESENLIPRQVTLARDDVKVQRLSWEIPAYKITANDSTNVGLVGNDLAGAWRLHSDVEIITPQTPQSAPDGHKLKPGTEVRSHTQNLYVPGAKMGLVAYVILRVRRPVNFKPIKSTFVDRKGLHRAEEKKNIGVLEVSGLMIVDDYDCFVRMSEWEPTEVSVQIDLMARAVCPKEKKVTAFEKSIAGLFPPE